MKISENKVLRWLAYNHPKIYKECIDEFKGEQELKRYYEKMYRTTLRR